MSLVSNLIGEISSSYLTGIKNAGSFDLNDTTFENLLQKQLENKLQPDNSNSISGLGIPPGFEIESLDGIDFSDTINNQLNTDNEEVTTSETVTFFTSLLNNPSDENNMKSELFDFAKKQASSLYNKYSRTLVTDVQDFVEDIQNLIN